MFSFHTTSEKKTTVFSQISVKTQQLPVILGSSLRKNSGRESIKLLYVIIFKKFRFQIVFDIPCNAKPAFSNPSGLKSVFAEKIGFRGRLVWTIDLTVEIKLCFQNSSGPVWTMP